MKTNDEILDQLTCCTIDDNADLDVKENFYYKYEDVIKAMNEARTQANGAEQSTSNCIKPAVINSVVVPEWLTDEIRALAKKTWHESKRINDGKRVEAMRIVQRAAFDDGLIINIKTATALLQEHCL